MKKLPFLICTLAISAQARMSERDFYETLSRAKTAFQPLAAAHQEELEIYADYDSEMDNAYSRREGNHVSITIFGGIKDRVGMNRDVLALAFCHELGHLYAGEPFSDPDLHKSLEGQADYWATQSSCIEKLLARQAPPEEELTDWWTLDDSLPWILEHCQFFHSDRIELCKRELVAIERLTRTFSRPPHSPIPEFSTPDLNVVNETLRTHPTPQCRMDTYLAGYDGKNRPLCWFKPSFDLQFWE